MFYNTVVLSEDPVGFVGGVNFYEYVQNDPNTFIDPLGLQGGPWHPPIGTHTKCLPTDDCSTIKGKMWILQRMIASHTGWDRTMPSPRGGNRHATDIAQLWTQYAECYDLSLEKCKDCDQRPVLNPDTARKTGTWVVIGTILYWTISEGSRILFPPRNLVPVP
jgi:uncharacterized protein RhaS with RHS repeats